MSDEAGAGPSILRRLLAFGGAGALAGAGIYGSVVATGAVTQPCAHEAIAEHGHIFALARIGREYLESSPDAEIARLMADLDPAGSTEDPIAILWRQAQGLLASAEGDFAAGRVVQWEGWMLARSEVDACALLALFLDTADFG